MNKLTSEVQFLESKNVNIIAGSGNHDKTINNYFEQGLIGRLEYNNDNTPPVIRIKIILSYRKPNNVYCNSH